MGASQADTERGVGSGGVKAKPVSLGEISTIVAGQSPPGSTYNEAGAGIPFFQGKADFGEVHPIARKYCTQPRKIAEKGDILISIRAPVGPTNIASERCCIGRGLAAIRSDEAVALRDFVHWSIVHNTADLVAKGQGSTFAAIGKSDLEALRFPLPPLDEQRRIAGILNRAARIERLRARAAECLDGFAPALFASMFGDPADNPMGWDVARLGEISTIAAGDPAPQEAEAFAENGPMFVRMQDVGRGHLNPSLSVSKDRLDPSWLSMNRLRLFPKNSILIPKSGVSVNLNHRAMLDTEAYVVSHLAVLIPDKTKVDPAYLFWWSVHYDPRKQVQVTSLPSLKLATLKAAPIPVPPLNMQRRFASIIRLTTCVFDSVKSASHTASTLTASLMDHLLDGDPVRRPTS